VRRTTLEGRRLEFVSAAKGSAVGRVAVGRGMAAVEAERGRGPRVGM
jgi:hypothetical protein